MSESTGPRKTELLTLTVVLSFMYRCSEMESPQALLSGPHHSWLFSYSVRACMHVCVLLFVPKCSTLLYPRAYPTSVESPFCASSSTLSSCITFHFSTVNVRVHVPHLGNTRPSSMCPLKKYCIVASSYTSSKSCACCQQQPSQGHSTLFSLISLIICLC